MESKSNLIATLRQVEKLIVWAQDGKRPSSDDLDLVHEGLLFSYGEMREGRVLGSTETSDTGLYRLVTGAMRELSEMNLPPSIDLSSVKTAVKTFKESIFVKATEHFTSKEQLYEVGNYCWACFRTTKLDAHHLITRGSCPSLIEEPDNLILLCRDCHNKWHNMGADLFVSTRPHLVKRYNHARSLCEDNRDTDK